MYIVLAFVIIMYVKIYEFKNEIHYKSSKYVISYSNNKELL